MALAGRNEGLLLIPQLGTKMPPFYPKKGNAGCAKS